MKLVKKFLLPFLFVSVLAVNCVAGELETPGFAPPPPSTSTAPNDADKLMAQGSETSGSVAQVSDMVLYEAFTAILSLF